MDAASVAVIWPNIAAEFGAIAFTAAATSDGADAALKTGTAN